MPIYIAMGFHTENGAVSPLNTRQFTDRAQAERQFYLYCAAACISQYESDTAMLMTADGFVIDRKTWNHDVAPEEEPAPEAGNGE